MPVILGMGAPTDLQEMSICTAYLGDHNSIEVLRDVVLASTMKLDFIKAW